jgi:hydrazine synthase alpha subunit-like protein
MTAVPTTPGMMNDFSANDFERRQLIGFAPVQSDGSFKIRVPANLPISFATLDQQGRGFVVKRTHLYVRPGEQFTRCIGCHEDRKAGGATPTNPNPMAALLPAHDLNIPKSQFMTINYHDNIGPIVAAKCVSCHIDTTAASGGLDLTSAPDTTMEGRIFPRGYVNLSGSADMMTNQVVVPPFPRRSKLIDYVLGLGSHAAQGPHPTGADALTPEEKRQFNLWVMLGAQYK